jgi:hypothetical protein
VSELARERGCWGDRSGAGEAGAADRRSEALSALCSAIGTPRLERNEEVDAARLRCCCCCSCCCCWSSICACSSAAFACSSSDLLLYVLLPVSSSSPLLMRESSMDAMRPATCA